VIQNHEGGSILRIHALGKSLGVQNVGKIRYSCSHSICSGGHGVRISVHMYKPIGPSKPDNSQQCSIKVASSQNLTAFEVCLLGKRNTRLTTSVAAAAAAAE
jgi:hypothetical protein